MKWRGYPMCDATWEPKENVEEAAALDEYFEHFPMADPNFNPKLTNIEESAPERGDVRKIFTILHRSNL